MKINKFYKIIFSILCVLFVREVEASEYTISPLVMDENFEARDIVTRDITLTNTAAHQVTIYPTVNNISLEDGGKIQKFLPPVESDRATSLAAWIEINRLGIDLKPGEERKVTVTFRVHPNPIPGNYHAFIGFPTGGNRDIAERIVAEGGAPGVLVNVAIEDKKNEFLKLSKFIVERFVTKPDNNAAEFTFINPGDETLVPEGEIILFDGRGKEVASIIVNPEKTSVAPGKEHTFTATIPVEGMFGKYKAFLSVEYGTVKRDTLYDTYFFYVLPLKMILIVLAVILVIVFILAWYFHARYIDDSSTDESDRLVMHIRDSVSESKEHDINLKSKE